MGIYTSNRYLNEAHDWASEIPANEAYGAAFGCAQILADCQANDMALFESTIYSDIAEVRAVQEGYGYVNENAFTDVIKKIVEMFKKLIAKIKGIFKAFLAKLTGAFKNSKDLVKKYEKQIIKYANWKDFKCKGIRVPKKGKENIQNEINKLFKTSGQTGVINYEIKSFNATEDASLLDTKLTGYDTEKKIEDADAEDIKNAIVEKYITGCKDINDLHTDVMDALFEDEETIEGDDQVKSASYFSANWIKTVLNEGEKWEKEVKKYNDKLEKNINTIIDNLNKDDDTLAKFMTNKDNDGKYIEYNKKYDTASDNKVEKQSGTDFSTRSKDTANGSRTLIDLSNRDSIKHKTVNTYYSTPQNVQKAIHALQKLASNEQEVITKVTSEYMTVVKFTLAQARKVWTAAAAWSSGVHKESVEYVNAVGESAAEQFYSNMEAIC